MSLSFCCHFHPSLTRRTLVVSILIALLSSTQEAFARYSETSLTRHAEQAGTLGS